MGVQVVVSDSYGYDGPWPGDHDNYDKLDQVIDEVVSKVAGLDNIAFDIWNEPNGLPVGGLGVLPEFWKASKQQFFHTWEHAVQRIKSKLPNAVIVGPSPNNIAGGLLFSSTGEKWMYDFLKFAHSHNVMPDVVSWHELLPPPLETRHGLVAEINANKLRSWMQSNGVPSRPFSINEYTAENEDLLPGTTVGYMAAIERSGVESAAHTCWNDDGGSNCWTGTLDGLLSYPSRQPRATWWVYEAYAKMAGTKGSIDRNTEVADAVASADASAARVLLGTYDSKHRDISVSLHGIPEDLQTGSQVMATAYRIYGTDKSEFSKPQEVFSREMPVSQGQLTVSLNASPEDAFVIEITQPSTVVV